MDRLAQYLKERENVDSISNDFGFVTYIIQGDECYIRDIWIDKRFRTLNEASKLADKVAEIARERGCKYLTGSVCPAANEATVSLRVLLGYGMELLKSSENLIIFKKDLF